MGCCSSKRQWQYMIDKYNLEDDELKQFENLFKRYAGIKNYMNAQDLGKLYAESKFEHSDEDIEAVFNAFANSSRKITLAEFVHLSLLCKSDNIMGDRDRYLALFKVMDCDNSGNICEREFRQFLSNFIDDSQVADKYFSKLDMDESKLIDFEEFCEFCESNQRMAKIMMAYVFPNE